ncbi:hypothetical protein ACFL1Z_09515 [Thermodesulfobacteriota bacterium]
MEKFYCPDLKMDVDTYDCDLCGDSNCEILKAHGGLRVHYYDKIRKRCERALDPEYLDLKKEDYSLKILSGKPSKTRQALTDAQIRRIIDALDVPQTDELLKKIQITASDYIISKDLWESRPRYSECKAVLEKIKDFSNNLSKEINYLFNLTKNSISVRVFLERSLRKEGCDLSKINKDLTSLYNATRVTMSDNVESRLPDMPFSLLVRKLKDIFEQATGEKYTLFSYDYSISRFLDFVIEFKEVIDQNISPQS